MRKFILIGVSISLLALTVVSAIFAQSDTTAPAWLGVAIREQANQVVIVRVQTGSPANAADLLIGDVIVAINDTDITTAQQVVDLIGAASAGDTATLDLLRNGEPVSITVTLGSNPNAPAAWDALAWAEQHLIADLTATDAGYSVDDVLESVNPYSLAEGDVVTTIHGVAVAELTQEALHTAMMSADATHSVVVTRAGESVTLEAADMGRHTLLFSMGQRGLDMPFEFHFEGTPFGGERGGMMPFGGERGHGGGFRFFFPDSPDTESDSSSSSSSTPATTLTGNQA